MLSKFSEKNNILWLTTKCNNNCIICQDKIQNLNFSKDFEEIKKEIDYFVSKYVKYIEIYGGEPFLNKNILKTINYLSKIEIKCRFSSNARIFSNLKFVKLINKIKNVEVVTTLFSHKKEIHDFLTSTPKSYEQTLRGIKNLVEEKIPVHVTIVLTNKNTNDLLNTIKLLINNNVKSIIISGLVDQGKMLDKHYLIPDFAEVKKNIKKSITFLNELNIDFCFWKLPLCVSPGNENSFVYDSQHKKKILIHPRDIECSSCKLKSKCMCS